MLEILRKKKIKSQMTARLDGLNIMDTDPEFKPLNIKPNFKSRSLHFLTVPETVKKLLLDC